MHTYQVYYKEMAHVIQAEGIELKEGICYFYKKTNVNGAKFPIAIFPISDAAIFYQGDIAWQKARKARK